MADLQFEAILLDLNFDGGTITWDNTLFGFPTFGPWELDDVGDDLTLTLADTFNEPPAYSCKFTGFYITAPNGLTYPVFQQTEDPVLLPEGGATFWVAFDQSQYDLAANLPSTGTVMGQDLSFQPTGIALCFAAGTQITTIEGEIAVEKLGIGDPITTADGRTVPVKWIGCQTVVTWIGPAERLMPVRVHAGALGDGLPLRDLTLTADHALLIDGLLVNAGALVNGSSIDWVPLSEFGDRYTVYHVETEDHDIILAEGAPAETFIDYVGRQAFDNYAEYVELYGEDRTIPEMDTPRISAARMLPPVLKARLGIDKAA